MGALAEEAGDILFVGGIGGEGKMFEASPAP